jgi:hypothetical protein
VMWASARSSRIPSRRAISDALMTTGVTPCPPRWLVAALGQLAAVLQPLRGAVRRRILLMDAHALPCCRGRTRHRRPAGRAISRVRPATIGRDGRARRGERYGTRGRGGPTLDGWLL